MKNIRKKLFFLLIASLICNHSASAGEALYGKEIKEQANSYFAKSNIDAQLILSDRRSFFFCSDKLKFLPKYENDWRTVNVSCYPENWSISIRTTALAPNFTNSQIKEISRTFPVAKLKKNISKGQVLEKQDIELVFMPKQTVFVGFDNLEEVIGRKAKVNLARGTVLKARHLSFSMAVNKNETVVISLGNNKISVITYGIALTSGQKGDMIEVEDINSKKVFKAIIVEQKKVKPLANM